MRLYLVRHGIAFDSDPARWPDDAARPLTARGVRRFHRTARGLRRLAPTIDVLLTSPFARTLATAMLLRDVAGWPQPVPAAGLGAGAGVEQQLAALTAHADVQVLALVGHEPHMHELASLLLTGDGAAVQSSWRKGAVAAIELPQGPLPGTGTLLWFLQPDALRRIGR